jgi:transposase
VGRTIKRWKVEILNNLVTNASNGPTEAVNLLVKKIKRSGHGFRNFENYRLRLLLHCGVQWNTAPTPRMRGRQPRLSA